MSYEYFDISFKIAAVEEYLHQKQEDDVSIRAFARSKGLSHATFYQWPKICEERKENSDSQEVFISGSERNSSRPSS